MRLAISNHGLRASGGIERANQWHAAVATLRAQFKDSTRPGPWTLELRRAVSATVRTVNGNAPRLEIEATGVRCNRLLGAADSCHEQAYNRSRDAGKGTHAPAI